MKPLDILVLLGACSPLIVLLASGLIQEEPFDDKLMACMDIHSADNLPNNRSKEIIEMCTQSFLRSNERIHFQVNMSDGGVSLVSRLMDMMHTHRQKRQARGGGRPGERVRRDIRALSRPDRRRLFRAFNMLKRWGWYDLLSSFHAGAADTAHGGPGFLPWHRMFILVVEEALVYAVPGTALAYWDSRADFNMEDPMRSVVWTEEYFGNGDGDVIIGPFAGWQSNNHGPLTRSIGTRNSSLLQDELTERIIGDSPVDNLGSPLLRNHQISALARPTNELNILERQHDGGHVWVGGLMTFVNSATDDPIFFFHHCFIDYLWEMFRNKQRRYGIDPNTDYPADSLLRGLTGHGATDMMFGFSVNNIYGYRDDIIIGTYRYGQAPSCRNRCNRSPHMSCVRGRCRSADRSVVRRDTILTSANGLAQHPTGEISFTQARERAELRGTVAAGRQFHPLVSDVRATTLPLRPAIQNQQHPMGTTNKNYIPPDGLMLGNVLLQKAMIKGELNRQTEAASINNFANNLITTATDPFKFASKGKMFESAYSDPRAQTPPIILESTSSFQPVQTVVPRGGFLIMEKLLQNVGVSKALNKMRMNTLPVNRQGNPHSSVSAQQQYNYPFNNPFVNNVEMSSSRLDLLNVRAPVVESNVGHNEQFIGGNIHNQLVTFEGYGSWKIPIQVEHYSILRNIRSVPSKTQRSLKSFEQTICMRTKNTFHIDGTVNVNKWAFMPVKLINKRISSASMNDTLTKTSSQSSERNINTSNNSINVNNKNMQSNTKIFVEVNGLNYEGTYKDFAFVDTNLTVQEEYAYVAFKNPVYGDTRAFVHAYDSLGRKCKPRCLVLNSKPPKYRPCSGTIRITSQSPKMYGNIIENTVNGKWDFKSGTCKNPSTEIAHLTFVCSLK